VRADHLVEWDRRRFLKVSGLAGGALLAPGFGPRGVQAGPVDRLRALSAGSLCGPLPPCSAGQARFEKNGLAFHDRCGGAGGGRGINVAVFDSAGDVESSRIFDTWDLGGQNQQVMLQLIAHLDAIPPGRTGVIAIADEGGFINWRTNMPYPGPWIENGYAAIERLGAQHIREVGYRQSWAMVFSKGVSPALSEAYVSCPAVAEATVSFTRAPVQGLNYGPFREGQAPGAACPTAADLAEDMALLRQHAKFIRTFGVQDCALARRILNAAAPERLRVALGLWLSGNLSANEAEIEAFAALHRGRLLAQAPYVIVGSEVLYREDLPVADLVAYVNRVRTLTGGRIPIAVAEPWHMWLQPASVDLANACDALFVNIHPYWESVASAVAVDHVFTAYQAVWQRFPTRRVVVSETGWPSCGDVRGAATPSVESQRQFLSEFTCRAGEARIDCFVFEAFDEPWKVVEGPAGVCWGMYDVNRVSKHGFARLPWCAS
jgi:exo-beta-1,3-glucanase (GH17 family)